MDIWKLSDAYVEEMMAMDPIGSTYLGDFRQDHLWSDFSMKGVLLHQKLEEKYLKKVNELDESKLSAREWIAYRVIKESLERSRKAFEREEHYYDLNTITSTFQVTRGVFDAMRTETKEHWDNIAARLEGVPKALKEYQSVLAEGCQKKKVVAKRQVQNVIKQATVLSSEKDEKAPNFYRGLIHQMKESALSDEDKNALASRMNPAVDAILKAIQEFIQFLEKDYLPNATETDGVGKSRYCYYAEKLLGSEIDPLAAYEWGWKEFNLIEAQMREVAKEIDPDKTLLEVIEAIKTDKELVCASQKEFADLMLERQKIAIEKLDGVHFNIPEEAKTIEVRLAPKGTSQGAWYQGPSEDFERSGQVWYSLGDREEVAYFGEVSTAYHEGFPGHHLQICVARLQKELSRFHRLCVWYPGYGEGWALYTEKLMGELGFYEKKAFLLGMLKEQLRRAFRVFVDIGLHLSLKIPEKEAFHPGETWNAELAEKFMIERVFEVPSEAHDEIARYLGWPGQAICYKLGEKSFLELRDYARSELKEKFDLKWFHQLVLDMGPLSLDMLDELVKKEVKTKLSA